MLFIYIMVVVRLGRQCSQEAGGGQDRSPVPCQQRVDHADPVLQFPPRRHGHPRRRLLRQGAWPRTPEPAAPGEESFHKFVYAPGLHCRSSKLRTGKNTAARPSCQESSYVCLSAPLRLARHIEYRSLSSSDGCSCIPYSAPTHDMDQAYVVL